MNASVLRDLLNDLLDSAYPSDVTSRLVVSRLSWNRIAHRAMLGRVCLGEQALSPHFWVEVGDHIIDFCAEPALAGQGEVPRGVFPASEVEGLYQGQEIVIDPLPEYLYQLIYRAAQHEPA